MASRSQRLRLLGEPVGRLGSKSKNLVIDATTQRQIATANPRSQSKQPRDQVGRHSLKRFHSVVGPNEFVHSLSRS
jgi:hypothetical protein